MAPNQTEDKVLSPRSSDSEASTVPISPYGTDYSTPSPTLNASGGSSTETGSNLNLDLPSPCGSEAVMCHSETPLQEESGGPTPSNLEDLTCRESIDLTSRDSETTVIVSADSDNGEHEDTSPF